jgi:adenylate cyclase
MNKIPQIQLLGPFKINDSEGRSIDFGYRKVQALLAYLAVERGRAQPREHLASLLWARTGDERARHNLRQALTKLRLLCPDLIETPGDTVALSPKVCSIDLIRFEEGGRAQQTGALLQALTLYRGDLLEGFTSSEADYQDWLEMTRGHLRKLACDIAERLIGLLRTEHRKQEAVDVLHRLLDLDRANETAHRTLIELLARSGRRSDALRQFQTCVSALEQELGVPPSPETRRLVDLIRQGGPLPSEGDAAPMPNGVVLGASHPIPSQQAMAIRNPGTDDGSDAGSETKSGAQKSAVLELPDKPSLIIKPFLNISADAAQDYFAEGLTKDINIALTKIPGLFLAADETPQARVAQAMTPSELGRQAGVRYVLTGGVRRQGDRVRVSAELIDAASGQCLWGERFDRELHDLFTIQDEITEEIVTAMDVKLVQGEAARYMRKALTDPAALEASYRGWYALYHGSGRADVLEAQRLFERVIELQPEVALGYASAALAYWAEAGFGRVVVRSQAMQHATELARKAIELGDTTGYAHLVMAVEHLARHEYDQAMVQATEGVAARPNCNGAYAIKSSVLNFLGRPREAIEFARYAVRLTPLYPAEFPAVLAASLHDSGRYEEAIAAAEASLKLRNDDIDPMLFKTAANVALGNLGEARETAARVKAIDPAFHLAEFAETQPYRNPQHLARLLDRLRQAGLAD